MGVVVSVSEFKAKCLELLDKLSRHEIDTIELTKRGKPIAVVNAKERPKPKTAEDVLAEFKAFQTRMAGSIKILDPTFDLTQPIVDIDDIDAYHGRVFPDDE
jgi:hypothetical protein